MPKFKPLRDANGEPIPDDEVIFKDFVPSSADDEEWQKNFIENAKAIVAEAQAKKAAGKKAD